MTKPNNENTGPSDPINPQTSNANSGGDSDSSALPPLSSIGPVDATDIGDNETFEQSRKLLDQIGPYRIIREIGEGGMDSVYEAEQTHPVKRSVAIKVIKAGRDSKQVIARFEAERKSSL